MEVLSRGDAALSAMEINRWVREEGVGVLDKPHIRERLHAYVEWGNEVVHFFAEICDKDALLKLAADPDMLSPYGQGQINVSVAFIVSKRGGRQVQEKMIKTEGIWGMYGHTDCERMGGELAREGATPEIKEAARNAMGYRH